MTKITDNQMRSWIDSSSYQSLLRRWRFAPFGSAWFQGEMGGYYAEAMAKKRLEIGHEAAVAASKAVGWEDQSGREET